jgi:hypothetical protein
MFDKTMQIWEVGNFEATTIAPNLIEVNVGLRCGNVSYSAYHGKATPEHLDKSLQLMNQNRLFSIQEIEGIFTP